MVNNVINNVSFLCKSKYTFITKRKTKLIREETEGGDSGWTKPKRRNTSRTRMWRNEVLPFEPGNVVSRTSISNAVA